jgi:hypothetical protein
MGERSTGEKKNCLQFALQTKQRTLASGRLRDAAENVPKLRWRDFAVASYPNKNTRLFPNLIGT